MSSDSSSEGESFAASGRKATTHPPRHEDSDVNRQSRSRRDARSFATASDTRSRRSGSRSPFRHRQASPRGQKRPYEDDRERHTPRSQDYNSRGIHSLSRKIRSYADVDGHGADSVKSNRQAAAPKEKAERARLRSPFRHKDEQKAEHQDQHDLSDRNKKFKSNFAPAAFRSNRYDSPGSDYSTTPATSLSDSPSYLLEKGTILTASDRPSGPDVQIREPRNPADTAEEVHPETPPTNVDEVTLIEQRRRRREEMRVKLLKTTIAQPGTPTTDGAKTPGRRSESPSTDQPTTPESMASPASPSYSSAGSINGLGNERPMDTDDHDLDSTMAADYDPSKDPEERVRLRMKNMTEVSAAQYNERRGEDRDVLIPVAKPADTASENKDEDLDMFADDNEDDMFAETTKKPESGNSLIAVPASHVKELDKSLLDQWDDVDGYYKVMPGELVQGRYEIVEKLGKGMFAEVVRARDRQTNNLVAIKIIRNNETMKKAGAKELEILRKLRQHDPDDKKHIVRLESSFEHKDHLCMVFENLSLDLRALLKKVARDRGLHLTAVRFFAHQLFLALHLMKKCDILHADLKPDNILVATDEKHLKVCDLGSATDTLSNEITPYLVSRFYRAPEVILGMKADYAIDMWAIGCTLFELYTGKILFAGHSNNQMLRAIMECRGKIPKTMLIKSGFVDKYFDGPDFLSLEKGKDLLNNNKEVLRRISFLRPTKDLRTRLLSNMHGLRGTELQEFKEFESLLDRCLTLNPEKRLTPSEAFQHPFIKRARR